jgi:aspartyl-tRNA(Asn)/glutamyl-tRNA(Gln) amidotransferase subunit A
MTHISRRAFAVSLAGALSAAGQSAKGADARHQAAKEHRRSSGGALDTATVLREVLEPSEDLTTLTLSEAAARVRAGTVKPSQLVENCLARIEIYNPKLNAFIAVLREQSMNEARSLEAELKAGKYRGPLHGIPIALKDNIDTAGVRTTAGSAVFDDRIPKEDAEVVRRLRAAGAIFIGKTNLHEFAMGGTSATSYFGPVRNPWALDRNSGGSSGGSAAAVATDLCYAALGTDTGGSIRTPSSYCGVVGLKPTYGLVPIRGIVPLIFSLDHCGPIVRSVEDAAVMLNALAGYDRLDIASVDHPKEDYEAQMKQPVSGFRLGIPRAPFFDLLDNDIAKAVNEAIGVLCKLTSGAKDVTLPSTSDIALNAEVFAYHEEYFTKSANRYMVPTRRSLQAGSNAKAAEYIRSRWKLELLRRTVDDSFRDFDLVVLPTRRYTPRTIDAAIKREENDKPRNPELENTQAFDAYGIPAISVPCGFTSHGLPVGLMIAGPRFSEGKILALSRAYQNATDWHKRQPPIRPDTVVPKLTATDEQ